MLVNDDRMEKDEQAMQRNFEFQDEKCLCFQLKRLERIEEMDDDVKTKNLRLNSSNLIDEIYQCFAFSAFERP